MQILSPAEFVIALTGGLIEYKATKPGVSINGSFIGQFAPHLAGRPVTVQNA